MDSDEHTIIDTETEHSESSGASFSTTVAAHLNPPPSAPPARSSITMSSSDMKIPSYNPFANLTVLKKGSFHEWKAKIITALHAACLGPFILTDQSPPTDPSKLEEYTVRNYQALSIIQTFVDSEHFQLVANSSTAREAYLAILSQYDDSGGLSTAIIFSEILSLRLDEGGNLSDHLHRFRTLHNELVSNMNGTPDLRISEAFIAILLLKSLPYQYSAIVQTTLSSFETIKLSRIYTILGMESSRNHSNTNPSDIALATSDSTAKTKPPYPKSNSNKTTCLLGHMGHTDENCKVRRFREMEKEIAELKKDRESLSRPEQAQTAAAPASTDPSYWDAAFTCHEDSLKQAEIADTGASNHMYGDESKFDSISPSTPVSISVASKDGGIVSSRRGKVTVDSLTLTNVLHSDKLSSNLISIGRLCDDGYTAVFRQTSGDVLDYNGRSVLKFARNPSADRLWHPVRKSPPHYAHMTRTDDDLNANLWHRRLGHLHPNGVINFLKATDQKHPRLSDFTGCSDCYEGKSSQTPSTSSFHRSPHVLDLVHSDLLGHISPPTKGAKKYILSFIDDHTRHNHIYLLASKDETAKCFAHYKALVERQTGKSIKKLKTDRGGEYSSSTFLSFLLREGIETERGPANCPQANSVAERFFRTLLGRMRAQLVQSGLPTHLWGELAMYCSLQINCAPSTAINMKIPINEYQSLMIGHVHPFDFNWLHPFGCLAFAHRQDRKSKLDPTSKRMIFIGLGRGARADRLWDKSTGRVLVSGDVRYQETVFPASLDRPTNHTDSTPTSITVQFPDYIGEDTSTTDTPAISAHAPDSSHQPCPASLPDAHNNAINPPTAPHTPPMADLPPVPTELRRSDRTRTQPTRYGLTTSDASSPEHDHPPHAQAMKGPDSAAWKHACKEEFESLLQHNVGTLVDPPAGANILGGMWRLSRKRDENNRIVRYKARWVAFGNHQIKGIDYADTHASVGSVNSLRILLAITAGSTWTIWQFDIKTAFLNGKIEGIVYVRQVKDFEHPSHPRRVWLLNQSLYGTKQAARCWQKDFSATAAQFKLFPCPSDSAVYILQDNRGTLIIHLHVDDSLVFCSTPTLITEFRAFLDSQYEVKWTTSPKLYLGIRLDILPESTVISQPHYIEAKLEEFGMSNCSMVKSPFPAKTVLAAGTPDEIAAAAELPYQSLVGSLQWIAHTTRPDIAYAVSQLSSFNASWTIDHWTKAKHVLRYLRFTQHHGIRYDSANKTLSMFSDSDFSQCPSTRRSITGYVATMGGGAVSWFSQRQKVVALSTTEAEYMACADAARHICWARSFLFDIFHQDTNPTTLHIKNTSAIANATNEGIKSWSKHIDRRHHFIREMVEDGRITVKQVSTHAMLADHLTKPLSPQAIQHAMSINNMVFGA